MSNANRNAVVPTNRRKDLVLYYIHNNKKEEGEINGSSCYYTEKLLSEGKCWDDRNYLFLVSLGCPEEKLGMLPLQLE